MANSNVRLTRDKFILTFYLLKSCSCTLKIWIIGSCRPRTTLLVRTSMLCCREPRQSGLRGCLVNYGKLATSWIFVVQFYPSAGSSSKLRAKYLEQNGQCTLISVIHCGNPLTELFSTCHVLPGNHRSPCLQSVKNLRKFCCNEQLTILTSSLSDFNIIIKCCGLKRLTRELLDYICHANLF